MVLGDFLIEPLSLLSQSGGDNVLAIGPRGVERLVHPLEEAALGNISWVQFSGSAAIAGHENVSSITDNGAGDFTVTWARQFATASSYAVSVCSSTANPFSAATGHFDALQTVLAGSVRTSFLNYSAAAASDPTLTFITAIGEF